LQKFPDNFGSAFIEESQMPQLKFEKYLTENDENNFMFGAFDGEDIIGICGFSREERGKAKHRGEIVQMYVNPIFKGQNIGNRLLSITIERAFENKEIEQIVLSVVADNKPANKAYEKIGFAEYGLLPNYFKDGERYWDQRFMLLERKNKALD
jgi:ribosomal protein S18 acetylase RimI-like enzyme